MLFAAVHESVPGTQQPRANPSECPELAKADMRADEGFGLGKIVSTGFDTGLVRRSVRRHVSANAALPAKAPAWWSGHLIISTIPRWYRTAESEQQGMDSALLQNLMTGAGSSSQFVGG